MLDRSLSCELKRIRLETNQHLYYSLLIRINDRRLSPVAYLLNRNVLFLDIFKFYTELNIFFVSLFLLHSNNFFNCFNYINLSNVFPKLISFNLSIIKQILNCKVHQATRIILHSKIICELFQI